MNSSQEWHRPDMSSHDSHTVTGPLKCVEAWSAEAAGWDFGEGWQEQQVDALHSPSLFHAHAPHVGSNRAGLAY